MLRKIRVMHSPTREGGRFKASPLAGERNGSEVFYIRVKSKVSL
jgi:hypothetical protein